MNTRALTLAILIAFFAVMLVSTYIDDQKSNIIKKYGKLTSVIVAKDDIKELDLIDDTKVHAISVPENFVAPGSFKSMKEIENTMATVPILKGEQITKPRITYPGAKTGLSRQVSVGKRAFSIVADDKNSVGRLIKPGDRVDVLAFINYAGGRKDKQKVKTVLQDVLVLSTGRSMTNSIPVIGVKTPRAIKKMNLSVHSNYNSVTLELDPYQVQVMAFLTNTGGRPYLSLRNNGDKSPIRIRSTDIYDVLGEDKQEAKVFFGQKYNKRNQ